MKCKKRYKVVKCVPFQLCVRCGGEGSIFIGQINPSTTAVYGWQPCDLCGGSKVIPMAVIPEKK